MRVIHGQYIRSTDRQLFGQEETFLCLSRGDLKGETENEIIAAQYQALQNQISCDKNITNRNRQ